MDPHKAPDEDEFPTLFYQHCWGIVAPSLQHYVSRIQSDPSLIGSINNTLIMLISKVEQPKFLTQFIHIDICNVIYKLVTKIMLNCVKPMLNNITSPSQSSFISVRDIHHNIIITLKLVHAMKRMKIQKTFMSIKIDMEKGYDKLTRNLLPSVFMNFSFPKN